MSSDEKKGKSGSSPPRADQPALKARSPILRSDSPVGNAADGAGSPVMSLPFFSSLTNLFQASPEIRSLDPGHSPSPPQFSSGVLEQTSARWNFPCFRANPDQEPKDTVVQRKNVSGDMIVRRPIHSGNEMLCFASWCKEGFCTVTDRDLQEELEDLEVPSGSDEEVDGLDGALPTEFPPSSPAENPPQPSKVRRSRRASDGAVGATRRRGVEQNAAAYPVQAAQDGQEAESPPKKMGGDQPAAVEEAEWTDKPQEQQRKPSARRRSSTSNLPPNVVDYVQSGIRRRFSQNMNDAPLTSEAIASQQSTTFGTFESAQCSFIRRKTEMIGGGDAQDLVRSAKQRAKDELMGSISSSLGRHEWIMIKKSGTDEFRAKNAARAPMVKAFAETIKR